MPTIRDYRPQTSTIQPNNRAAQARARTAAGDASTYSQIGQQIGGAVSNLGSVVQAGADYYAQKELSQGAALVTKHLNDYTTEWQERAKNSNPNDATIRDTFLNDFLYPKMDEFVGSFDTAKGREWAQGQAERIKRHFNDTTRADVGSRAATAAAMNAASMVSNLGNVTYRDPTSLDTALDILRGVNDTTKLNLALDPATAARFDAGFAEQATTITVAGLKGFADANPEQFLADMEAGAYDKYDEFLDPDTKSTLRKYAANVQKAKVSDAASAAVERRRIEQENIDAAANTIYQEFFDVKEDGAIHIKDGAASATLQLGMMPGANESLVTSMLGAQRAIRNDEDKRIKSTSDPVLVGDFEDRSFLPEDDPNRLSMEQLYRARSAGELSNQDFGYFRQALLTKDPVVMADRKVYDEWVKGYLGYIDDSTLFSSGTPEAKQRAMEFRRQKWQEFRAARTAGKSQADAFKNLADDIQQYQRGTQESIGDLTRRATEKSTPLPPIKPEEFYQEGESMEDFAKRLSGETPVGDSASRKGDRLDIKPVPTLEQFNDWFGG